MSKNIRIVSTKKLLPNQKQFLLNANFSVIEADFIQTKSKEFQIHTATTSLLFTSQNAVKSFLKNEKATNLKDKKIFCVGVKTKALLEENGYKVLICKEYASELAQTIVTDFAKETITFFCGNLRRDTLPEAFTKAGIFFEEIQVYETSATSQKINTVVDGILFFSPSGIKSYLENNTITNEMCFCIGTTTAEALTNPINNRIIANHQTVENVIIQAINYYTKASE